MAKKIKKSKVVVNNNQNFMMFLAGFLVVGLGIMAYSLYNTSKVMDPLDSDEVSAIETNLTNTNLKDIDSEILQIESELK